MRWRRTAIPAVPAAPGLHGKVPTLGDFVTRGLPGSVLRALEAWLESWVQEARTTLGAEWQIAWHRAPVWHATFGAGLLSSEPWAAVVIPSVDRVGRNYPFAVLAPLHTGGGSPSIWHDDAEALALRALEDRFDADALVLALRALQAPAAGTAPPIATDWSRPAVDPSSAVVAAGLSLWWSCPEPPTILALHLAGLPAATHAAGLVLGLPSPEA